MARVETEAGANPRKGTKAILVPGEAISDHLLAFNKIKGETRKRLLPHAFEAISKGKVEAYEADGWVVEKELKTRTKMRREKRHERAFEDRVWAMCAQLQFSHLNRDGSFKLSYGAAPSAKQQIDVFAADEESVLLIECKSSETIRPGQFKTEVEAIRGRRQGDVRRVQEE